MEATLSTVACFLIAAAIVTTAEKLGARILGGNLMEPYGSCGTLWHR